MRKFVTGWRIAWIRLQVKVLEPCIVRMSPFIFHELLASRGLVQANGMVSRDEKGAFDSGASDAQDIIDTELTRATRRARLKYVFLESRQPNINSM